MEYFTKADFQSVKTRKDLMRIAEEKGIEINKHLRRVRYLEELTKLQAELVNFQKWVEKKQLRIAVVFEGRDAAGKGGCIKRFTEHLNPRTSRVVALSKPTDVEKGQWYFRRYVKELPNPGEIVFFDRSWYNRAVVEPVMGFCTAEQYNRFIFQVPEFEHMLKESGIHIIKFWFSVSKDEQKKRFESRLRNPLKVWKYSPVDMMGQQLWNKYTRYKEQMFAATHTTYSPWVIVKGNDKKIARLESIRYVLNSFNYTGRGSSKTTLYPDPNVVARYYREVEQIDI